MPAGIAGTVLAGGMLIAGTALPTAAATPTGASNAVRTSGDSNYSVTSATSFINVAGFGQTVLVAQDGEQYVLGNCSAHLTADGAGFSGCTGSGPADFFGGQTPTAATLSGVPRDGSVHSGQLALTTATGARLNIVVETVNFPVSSPATGCVFLPDSTTAAFTCAGGRPAHAQSATYG